MAQALKSKDIYLLESNKTAMEVYTAGEGFFDRSLNFIRNTDKYVEGLKLAQHGIFMNKVILVDDEKLSRIASDGRLETSRNGFEFKERSDQ